MREQQGSRRIAERPAASRRNAFAPPTPRHQPIAAAPSAAATLIPDKLYFRIGEVARLCDVQAYVLRFWETEFPQLRPNKGGTGQRLFRRRDVEVALRIRHLLYDEGYTIPGARQLLRAETRPRDTQLNLVEDPAAQQLRRDRLLTLYRGLCDLHTLVTRPITTPQPAPILPPPRRMPPRRPTPAVGSLFADPEPTPSAQTGPNPDPTP